MFLLNLCIEKKNIIKRFTFIDKLANEKWNVEITNIVKSQKFKGIYKSGAEQIMNLLKNRMDVEIPWRSDHSLLIGHTGRVLFVVIGKAEIFVDSLVIEQYVCFLTCTVH